MFDNSLFDFIQEIESHCITTAIATFLDTEGEIFVVDLQRDNNYIKYVYKSYIKEQFLFRLQNGVRPNASLILRSFTSEINKFTKLPVKELMRLYFNKKKFSNSI